MRKYYYDPSLKGYYASLKKLANAAGNLSEKQALYNDIRAGVALSPSQERVFIRYYVQNLGYLEARISECKAELKAEWQEFKRCAEIAGVPYPSEEIRRKFYYALISREQDCDFRSWLHRRLNTINSRITRGQEIFIPDEELLNGRSWVELQCLTIEDFLRMYDDLCKNRRGREQIKDSQ